MRPENNSKILLTMKNNWILQEMFNSILMNLSFINTTQDKKIQVIAITSPNKGEGKSFFLNNYGLTSAINKKKTLLIDADFYNPTLTRNYHLKNHPGFSNMLINRDRLVNTIQKSDNADLDILPVGTIPPNPLELLANNSFFALMSRLKESYELILIDCPPVQLFTESRVISANSDGVILITTPTTTEKDVANSKELLEKVNAKILGAVLNKKVYSETQLAKYKNYKIEKD